MSIDALPRRGPVRVMIIATLVAALGFVSVARAGRADAVSIPGASVFSDVLNLVDDAGNALLITADGVTGATLTAAGAAAEGAAGGSAGIAGVVGGSVVAGAGAGLIAAGIGYGVYSAWQYFHDASPGSDPGANTQFFGLTWSLPAGCSEVHGDYCDPYGVGVVQAPAPAVGSGNVTIQYNSGLGTAPTLKPMIRCGSGGQEQLTGQPWVGGSGVWNTTADVAVVCSGVSGGGFYGIALRTSTGNVTFRATASAADVVGAPSSSSHTLTGTFTGSDGSMQTTTATYDSTNAGTTVIPLPTWAPGVHGVSGTVTDSDGTTTQTVIDMPAPENWTDPQASPYPDCEPGGANAPCVMRIQRSNPTETWQTCGVDVDCPEWEAVPDKSLTRGTASRTVDGTTVTDTYRCLWGTYEVPLDHCDDSGVPYEGTEEKVGGGLDGKPGEIDPITGDGSGCFPHGWAAFNPLEWVYKPVVCALKYTFVPDAGKVATATQSVVDAWDGTAPGVLFHALDPLFTGISHMADGQTGDCQGPLFSIPLPTGGDFSLHPLNLCSPLAQYVLGVGMPLLTAFIYLASFGVGVKVVAAAIGAKDLVAVEDGA